MVGRARFLATIAVGTNVDTLTLNDTLNTQLSSMADMYGLYRFTHIKLVLPGGAQFNSAAAPHLFGVGFTPEVLITPPTTLAEALQLPYWCGHNINITTGSNVLIIGTTDHQSFSVPKNDLLKTSVKWFRTQGKGTESDWENQGTFVFGAFVAAATTATTFEGWIEYECEFTDQLPLASTLEFRKRFREMLTLKGGEGPEGEEEVAPALGQQPRDEYGTMLTLEAKVNFLLDALSDRAP